MRTSPNISFAQFWQWPNLLALDAVIVAAAWQFAFETSLSSHVTTAERIVLAFSVWLTYMADRLFDSRKHPPIRLLSSRHQFAKRNSTILWRLWWSAFSINCVIAFTNLDRLSLKNGFCLLSACLLYTALNQTLSKRFFPKELCVALIFAGGVIIFLDTPLPWFAASAYALLCLCNCVAISLKELKSDQVMGLISLSSIRPPFLLPACFAFTALSTIWIHPEIREAILISLVGLFALQRVNRSIQNEVFHLGVDGVLLLGPTYILIKQFI